MNGFKTREKGSHGLLWEDEEQGCGHVRTEDEEEKMERWRFWESHDKHVPSK